MGTEKNNFEQNIGKLLSFSTKTAVFTDIYFEYTRTRTRTRTDTSVNTHTHTHTHTHTQNLRTSICAFYSCGTNM
jgi:hypothetical protein